MQNYKIVLSYDGTEFSGWQRQPEKRTVQGELEAALSRIAGKPVNVIGAGRTDAGVHALGQAASFKASFRLDDAQLAKALNANLPETVRVSLLERVPPDWNARRKAIAKTYQYRIWTARQVSPFDVRYVLHWPSPLDVAKIRRAARLFVREADFSGFSSNTERCPVRRVTRSDVRQKGSELVYTIEGNGFLRYMVRTIVGTLLEVGRGQLGVEDIERIFAGRKRTLASRTAPAKGLCLLRVVYEPPPGAEPPLASDKLRPRTRPSSSGFE
ncbi:MAG: tRNA pseudouridine(38-40) synthase TruA [Candidatus Aminicenantes bacterium]|nr:tRNA pseudouridine(38-40) synthase TruA [Candidatus Aminicenantes bacterium]